MAKRGHHGTVPPRIHEGRTCLAGGRQIDVGPTFLVQVISLPTTLQSLTTTAMLRADVAASIALFFFFFFFSKARRGGSIGRDTAVTRFPDLELTWTADSTGPSSKPSRKGRFQVAGFPSMKKRFLQFCRIQNGDKQGIESVGETEW